MVVLEEGVGSLIAEIGSETFENDVCAVWTRKGNVSRYFRRRFDSWPKVVDKKESAGGRERIFNQGEQEQSHQQNDELFIDWVENFFEEMPMLRRRDFTFLAATRRKEKSDERKEGNSNLT